MLWSALIPLLLTGCTLDCVQDDGLTPNAFHESNSPLVREVTASSSVASSSSVSAPNPFSPRTILRVTQRTAEMTRNPGYSNACALVAIRFRDLTIRATSELQRQYFRNVSAEFRQKALLPDPASRDSFNHLLEEYEWDLPIVFGSAQTGLRVFQVLVAASEFSGTSSEVRESLLRTFDKLVLNEHFKRLPDWLIETYIRVMNSVIPLAPGAEIASNHLQAQLSHIEREMLLL